LLINKYHPFIEKKERSDTTILGTLGILAHFRHFPFNRLRIKSVIIRRSSLFILFAGIKGPETGIQPIVCVSENY